MALSHSIKNIGFGNCNVRTLYRTGAVTLVAQELAVHDAMFDGNSTLPIVDNFLYYGGGNNN